MSSCCKAALVTCIIILSAHDTICYGAVQSSAYRAPQTKTKHKNIKTRKKVAKNLETNIIPRLHLAIDLLGSMSGSDTTSVSIQGEIGVHSGLNLKIDSTELTFFFGLDLSLNLPWTNPYAKSALFGIEITTEIHEPIRLALQAVIEWNWYQRKDTAGTVWNPDVSIPLQLGLEFTLLEGKRSELSLQVLGGIAPQQSIGAWSMVGVCTIALHANL